MSRMQPAKPDASDAVHERRGGRLNLVHIIIIALKKAFNHSDAALQSGEPEDRCLAELFKAVDTAKTLRRSLRGEDTSHGHNRQRFMEVLGLEIPACRPDAQKDAQKYRRNNQRTGQVREYSQGDIIYDVRCMTQENDNLNLAENVDYHILLDWSHPTQPAISRHNPRWNLCL